MRVAHVLRIIAVFVLSGSSIAWAMAPHQITRIACYRALTGVQCILSSNNTLSYRYFFLKKPVRLVFDIQQVQLQKKLKTILLNNAVLRKIRYAQRRKDNCVRLVFELTQLAPLTVKERIVSGQHETVLTFKPRSITPAKVDAIKFYNAYPTTLKPPHLTSTRNVMVVIDPGHGGKDPGAIGARGVHEKEVVLRIAKHIQKIINQQRGFTAVLTRKGDYYLTLRERLAIARKYRPDMYIAIHADAYPRKNAEGASVYALSLRGATSEAARWLATKENESELMGGVDLGDKSELLKSVLLNLSQSATIRSSLVLGRGIIHALGQVGPLHRGKVEQAAFVVLKSPDIPSLLVETGFISNYNEERKLSSSNYQKQLARSITHGICNYFTHHPPRDSWLALQKNKFNA